MLIGTPVDFKRFEKRSIQSIDAKGKDSLDTDYPRNEGRLTNRFFPEKRSLDVSLGPYQETSVSKSPPKNRFLFGLGRPISNMLSIFQDDRSATLSNRMGLFRDLSRSTKTCQAQTNNKVSTAKIDIS